MNGTQLLPSAREIAAALGGRRSGNGWVAKCPAHRDSDPSLSVTERNGTILVHCFAGCDQRALIEALRDLGVWPEKADRTTQFSPAERRAYARDLDGARYWVRAAISLTETELTVHKARLFDASQGLPDTNLIYSYSRIIERLRRVSDRELVAEYREWRDDAPEHVAGMIWWARKREIADVRAVVAYFQTEDEASRG